MDSYLNSQEQIINHLYSEVFDELSRLQIEEAFLKRQAQNLIDKLIKEADNKEEMQEKIYGIIEEHDTDFILQDEYMNNLQKEGIIKLEPEEEVQSFLNSHFGSHEATSMAFKTEELDK